jgi:hypothetical protein
VWEFNDLETVQFVNKEPEYRVSLFRIDYSNCGVEERESGSVGEEICVGRTDWIAIFVI